jgi:hypothetical protein
MPTAVAPPLGLAAAPAPAVVGQVTYYCCTAVNVGGGTYCPGDVTASGRPLRLEDSGRVAACSYRWELGEWVMLPDGRRVECIDRGLLDEYGVDVDEWVYECP